MVIHNNNNVQKYSYKSTYSQYSTCCVTQYKVIFCVSILYIYIYICISNICIYILYYITSFSESVDRDILNLGTGKQVTFNAIKHKYIIIIIVIIIIIIIIILILIMHRSPRRVIGRSGRLLRLTGSAAYSTSRVQVYTQCSTPVVHVWRTGCCCFFFFLLFFVVLVVVGATWRLIVVYASLGWISNEPACASFRGAGRTHKAPDAAFKHSRTLHVRPLRGRGERLRACGVLCVYVVVVCVG